MIQQVCVYCASSTKIAPKYFQAAAELAEIFVQAGITVVFGGGKNGLMGQLADKVIEKGGRIIGIMPNFMKEVELAHKGVDEIHFVADMHERKKRFLDGTDALVALPGGCGTLEELLEALTLKRLGLFVKPIVILNQDGFYDPLIEMLNRCVEEHFMGAKHLEMWQVVETPGEVLDAINNSPDWDESALNFAAVK
ncbi:MAG: TIGR00730 family Rossman fold protein [Bacteroidota bacterium]